MSKQSKIFLAIFFAIIFISTGISFYKFFILKDYYITVETACDPQTEQCLSFVCDPNEDDACSATTSKQVSYYKLIEKNASTIPLCDPDDNGCTALSCDPSEDCREIFSEN